MNFYDVLPQKVPEFWALYLVWTTEESMLDSRQAQKVYLFSKTAIRALGSTQSPPVQWVREANTSEVREANTSEVKWLERETYQWRYSPRILNFGCTLEVNSFTSGATAFCTCCKWGLVIRVVGSNNSAMRKTLAAAHCSNWTGTHRIRFWLNNTNVTGASWRALPWRTECWFAIRLLLLTETNSGYEAHLFYEQNVWEGKRLASQYYAS
jgi:hypothetical protein